MTRKISQIAMFIALLGALWSCGDETPDEKSCLRDPSAVSATPFVEATPAQLQEGQALVGSYLVAFRSELGGPGLRHPSFAAEHRAFHGFLTERIGHDPRVRGHRFLTAIDLSRPEGVDRFTDLDPPPLLRLFWSQGGGHEPLVGAIAQVDFNGHEAATSAIEEWMEQGRIWFAEPNYISRPYQEPSNNLFQSYAEAYEGTGYWWLKSINIVQAMKSIAARDTSIPGTPTDDQILASRPIIAVLDSGVDYEHPALRDRMWVNTNPNAAGCVNDIHGCNTTERTNDKLGNGDVWPFDTAGPNQSCQGRDNNCSHGTHVAGIIAGDHAWADDANRRAAGICPVCRIMALKIVNKVGNESGILDSSIVAAFTYISRIESQGRPAVRVVNASFGKFVRSRSVGLLIRLLREKRGTLVVAAAGNEDTLTREYPAAFEDAIAVAAVDSQLHKVSFSNFGRWVDISAPGQAILAPVPGNSSDSKSGTSMAAPMVAGVAGLMIARYPDISFDALRSAIISGADPSLYGATFAGGYNSDCYYPKIPQDDVRQPLLGTGLLDANAAINLQPSQGLPIFSSLNRVRPGCGIVSSVQGESNAAWGLLLIALPVLAAGLAPYRRQLSRATLRKRRSSPERLP